MNRYSVSPQLLEKYLAGECTIPEKEEVEKWYSLLSGPPDFLNSLPEGEQGRLRADTYSQIRERLTTDPIRVLPASSPAGRRLAIGKGWWVGVAASVALIVALWIVYPKSQNSAQREVVAAKKETASKNSAKTVQFVNDQSCMVMHRLPDGSTVWMQTDARITYPDTFETDGRLVAFEGEAFFEVKSDKKRPFVIQSGEMRIEVLGTSFNVKAPPRQKIYEVAVVSGSVSVSIPATDTAPQKIVLTPQQQALFETRTKRLSSSTMPTESKKEIYEPVTIIFEGTPLDQVADKLSRCFDIRIYLADPAMKSCRLTADFDRQSLPAILEMLCATLDATYTMSGKTILLEGVPCE